MSNPTTAPRRHLFSTEHFSLSEAAPTISQPFIPGISNGPGTQPTALVSPAPPFQPGALGPHHTPRSSHQSSPTLPAQSYLPPTASPFNPYTNTNAASTTLSPHPSYYQYSSPHGDISENTTPSFEVDVDIPTWDEPTGDGPDDILSAANFTPPPALEGDGALHSRSSWPISPRATKSPSPATGTKRTMQDDHEGENEDVVITKVSEDLEFQNLSPVQVKIEEYSPGGEGLFSSVEPFNTQRQKDQKEYGIHAQGNQTTRSTIGDNNTMRGAQERDDEGVWGGLSPEFREGFKEGMVSNSMDMGQGLGYLDMNLKDHEQFRKIQEKNSEVEDWIRRSASVKSKKPNSDGNLMVPSNRGRRARSFSDLTDFAAAGRRSLMLHGRQLADDDEDLSSEDDESVNSSFVDGSLDNYDGPPSPVADPNQLNMDIEDDFNEAEKDPNNLPEPRRFYSAKAFREHPSYPTPIGGTVSKTQPSTANGAMMLFNRYAENIETASRVATSGSQCRFSAGDLESVVGGESIKRLSFGKDGKDWEKVGGRERPPGSSKERKLSIFDIPLMKLKRISTFSGESTRTTPTSPLGESHEHKRKESISNSFMPPRLRTSWMKNDLKLDTAGAIGAMVRPLAAVGAGETTGVYSPGAWTKSLAAPIPTMKRTRSKSDLSVMAKLRKPHPTQDPQFGIATMLRKHGGPPAVPITSPTFRRAQTFSPSSIMRGVTGSGGGGIELDENESDSDDDMEQEIPVRLQKKLVITPTMEGFAQNVKEMYPALMSKLVDRITNEQMKRHKKLLDHRDKHNIAVKAGKCISGGQCASKTPAPNTNSQGAYSNDYGGDSSTGEGNIIANQLPLGVPIPPVTKLPADFECPICFKMKKFNKPSDWTKHVHEDLQPFTCTFPDCNEPKSFKRKADWVRHENERHRHLEWWTCTLPDCQHTCYRKDNFVQHLVREHKKPEPKVKAAKAAARAGGAGPKGKGKKKDGLNDLNDTGTGDATKEEIDKVWEIVEECHKETTKLASSEKCKFCGATCGTWKKLTVHLARHMESISLPILDLIRDDVPSQSLSSPQPPTSTNNRPITPMYSGQMNTPSVQVSPVADTSGMDFEVGNTHQYPHGFVPGTIDHPPLMRVSNHQQPQHMTNAIHPHNMRPTTPNPTNSGRNIQYGYTQPTGPSNHGSPVLDHLSTANLHGDSGISIAGLDPNMEQQQKFYPSPAGSILGSFPGSNNGSATTAIVSKSNFSHGSPPSGGNHGQSKTGLNTPTFTRFQSTSPSPGVGARPLSAHSAHQSSPLREDQIPVVLHQQHQHFQTRQQYSQPPKIGMNYTTAVSNTPTGSTGPDYPNHPAFRNDVNPPLQQFQHQHNQPAIGPGGLHHHNSHTSDHGHAAGHTQSHSMGQLQRANTTGSINSISSIEQIHIQNLMGMEMEIPGNNAEMEAGQVPFEDQLLNMALMGGFGSTTENMENLNMGDMGSGQWPWLHGGNGNGNGDGRGYTGGR